MEINNTSENILERIPLYETTEDLDREEGIEINAMKATHKSPIPVKDLSENDDIDKTAFVTSVDFLLNWARKSSIFPAQFGLACCAFEMIASAASRFDLARFGAERFSATPRQADLMIVAGTVTIKMAERVKSLYEQMSDPKYVISMGSGSNSGGPYWQYGYHVLKGVDLVVPVDVYVPGCPPRPEALIQGILELQKKMSCLEIQLAIANDKIIRLQESEFKLENEINSLKEKVF